LKTLFALLLALYVHAAQFVIVVPSYNNRDCYKKNLDSIFTQNYENYRVIYIDDASPDGTGTLVQAYLEERDLGSRVTLIRNENNQGALANIYRAVWECSPKEIVVNLDGDDWFAHRNVLEQLNEVYSDRNVWLTYGQFIYYPSYKQGFGIEIPSEVVEQNAFRTFTKGTTALRTFYAGLFHQIKKEDLFFRGDFFKVGYDLAIMLPMLEMAGRHIRFIPEISYVYNFNSPINDHKIHFDEQAEVDRFIRAKEKYTPLLHYNSRGPAKKVYITPGLWGQLFDIGNPFFNRDNCLDVLYQLRTVAEEAGYEILQADSLEGLGDFEKLIVFDVFLDQLPDLEKFPKEKLILFLWEPPSVLPENFNRENHHLFSKVYTWNDALVDGEKYFKFYYPVFRSQIPDPIGFHFKRLCTMVACNKTSSYPNELYSKRRQVIDFFERFPCPDFDLFGKWWPRSLKTYQGPIDKKVDVLKYYKFCFAYENVEDIPGYITEKIFDCFQAGTVPIYLGAPNIEQYIPKNCMINRADFVSDQDLYEAIEKVSAAEYAEYMKNIRIFLESDLAKLYSIENFIQTVMRILQ